VTAQLASAIAWACIGKVDIIANAPGHIVPVGKTKTVQPLEAGVIRAIKVDDGDHVLAGDALIELDPTQAEADRVRFTNELVQASLDQARLLGLRQAWQHNCQPSLADPPKVATGGQLDAATAAMEAQYAEQNAKLASLDQQITQKRAESDEAIATIAKLKASLPLVEQEADLRRKIMEMQWGNKIAYLEAQQRLVEQQHEPPIVDRKRLEAEAARAALERQREQTIAEYKKRVLDDLAKAGQQADESRQNALKASQRKELQTLRAPIDGTVQQLAVHTIGGVVTPAQSLLVIVPENPHLVVEARVDNKDVGFVHPDQDVEIKVEAFNFVRYGLLHGRVLSISRDAMRSDQNKSPATLEQDYVDVDRDPLRRAGNAPGYIARLSVEETAVATENGVVPVEPGMSVSAEIKTGRRRVIDFLLSPLIRYRQEGLRER
jgi:hemolysin D